MKKRTNPLPLLDGVKPSYLVLPHEKQFYGLPLLHFLCAHFPFVGEENWRRRLNSGFVVGADGVPFDENTLFEPGKTMFYYRETSRESEPRIPFEEKILHIDEHLIVVDKPHFLPVIPSGRFLRETLLTRLRLRPELQHLNVEDITPIHRLDKDTAGVMLLSLNPATRRDYQTMFQEKTVRKPMKRWRRRGRIWTIRWIFRHEWNAAKNSSSRVKRKANPTPTRPSNLSKTAAHSASTASRRIPGRNTSCACI